MKEITKEEFINCYNPIVNNCTPYPCGILKENLGDVIWDKRDYSRIASYLNSKVIWSIFEDDDSYYIIPVIQQNLSKELVGYIVTEFPYNTNDISNLKVIIEKDIIIEEFNIY